MKKSYWFIALSVAVLATQAYAANDSNYTYLALGDSVSFGFNPLLATPGATPAQFVGYPEVVAQIEHLTQSKKEVNASCPGETSSSYLLGVQGPVDNGCNFPHVDPSAPPFKSWIGLHTNYSTTQNTFATAQLQSNKHINTVTLSIGANDLLLVAAHCSYVPGDLSTTHAACVQQQLLDPSDPSQLGPAMLTYASNLTAILTAIRVNAHYQGKLILMTYYSPSTDPLFMSAIGLLNHVMVQVGNQFGVTFADGFGAYQIAARLLNHDPSNIDPCQAGLLVKLPGTTSCDVHPSALGQEVLAGSVVLAGLGK